jgi:hypothetical protein
VLSSICTMFVPEFGITNVLFIRCGRRRIRFGGHRSEQSSVIEPSHHTVLDTLTLI